MMFIFIAVGAFSTFYLSCVTGQKYMNAFGNDINKCLFGNWMESSFPIMKRPVDCTGNSRTGLCYGTLQKTLFAVCYNSDTLIPDFTGHVVLPFSQVPSRGSYKNEIGLFESTQQVLQKRGQNRGGWRNENGNYAPKPQSDVKEDYKQIKQKFGQNICVYNRGHLTPYGNFELVEEREFTMVNTNIAPQCQDFNGGKWKFLEDAVKNYSTKYKSKLYVITGTARLLEHKHVGLLKLNKRVTVPEYFWKAICDPKRKMRRSVVYTARNPTDSEKVGFLEINSVKMLKEKFPEINLPEFDEVCNPDEIGDFLEEFLKENF